ncbi:MAG: PBP1A family penicillin-binding protein [Clostridia bacterium]
MSTFTTNTQKKKIRFNAKRFFLMLFLIISLIGITVFSVTYFTFKGYLDTWDPNNYQYELSTNFYDIKGQPLTLLHGVENRTVVEFKQIPNDLKDAFISTEDPDFYHHYGISPKAFLRAGFSIIKNGRITQGGSTITMQLVKNAYIDPDARTAKSFRRKISEIFLALEMERRYTKDEIFEMYLNVIPFGRGAYGVQAAAETYFGKDVKDLNLAECALIAGLTQSPSNYDPYKNMDAALGRRSMVLSNMVKAGSISEAESAKAKNSIIVLANKENSSANKNDTNYFIDAAIDETETILEGLDLSTGLVYTGGLKIYTTEDPLIQAKINEVFADPANFPEDIGGIPVQSAFIILNHKTGGIAGLMGGRTYETKRGLNRATQMLRQPGSTIKPLVSYGPALEKGYGPASIFIDAPVSFGKYKPNNMNGNFGGLTDMRTAIQNSINIPAVQCLNTIGIEAGWNFGKALGLPLLAEDKGLGLALGGLTKGVAPINMAGAYGAFANGGVYIEPHIITKILDQNNKIIYLAKQAPVEVMSPQTSYLMTSMLKTVVDNGTGTKAKMKWPVAGKTGTTQLPDLASFNGKKGNTDAWFAGYTTEYTGITWMGFDRTDPDHYMKMIYGGKYPALIWKQVMQTAMADFPVKNFATPKNIEKISIDKKTGTLPSELTPIDYQGLELFNSNDKPSETSSLWVLTAICLDSKQLATINCPNVVAKVKIKLAGNEILANTKDRDLLAPANACPLHVGALLDSGTTIGAISGGATEVGTTPGTITDPPSTTNGPIDPPTNGTLVRPTLSGTIISNTVNLSWNSSGNNITYSLERWSNSNPARQNITVTKELTFADVLASPGVYYYKVTAIDQSTNNSLTSNTFSVTMQ